MADILLSYGILLNKVTFSMAGRFTVDAILA
jgi:hypothetical protein